MNGARGGGHDVQLLAGQLRQLGVTLDQRSAGSQFGGQQLDTFRLGQRPVIGMHARPGQQLGDDLLVHIGVLPQIETGQMKPKDVHGFPQPGQPVVSEHPAAVGAQRPIDDIEVGEQLGRRQVALEAEVELVFGLTVEDLGRRRGQPPVNDPHSAAVRFVGAGRLDGTCRPTPRARR